MKILHTDIETAPNTCYTWGLFNQNLSIDKIITPGYTLCWAAKWHKEKGVLFDSLHNSTEEEMLFGIWQLLDEADAVVHYNGTRFDIPVLNMEFVKMDWPLPSPYHQIDLYKVVRSSFRFASNKLDWVCQELSLGAKVKHKGMDLWKECIDNDPKAWKKMESYNKQDVRLLPKLYERLLPWIRVHPNHALYTDDTRPVCVNCGSEHLVKRGTYEGRTMSYQRYNCAECGKWQRGRGNILTAEKKKNILVGVS